MGWAGTSSSCLDDSTIPGWSLLVASLTYLGLSRDSWDELDGWGLSSKCLVLQEASSGLSMGWCPQGSQQEERPSSHAQGFSRLCLCLLMPQSSSRVQRNRQRGPSSNLRLWDPFIHVFGILAFIPPTPTGLSF